jgi:hypothetical protein
MKHIVEAGTDAATLVLFDPAGLPPDFNRRFKEEPVELFEELNAAGKTYSFDAGADGSYLLHAYVDEPVPSPLAPYAHDPIVVERFQVPSGRLYFTGQEYAFQDDDAFLRKYPHMSGCFDVQPGAYRLTLFRMEYPDGLQEQDLREQLTAWQFRVHQSMGSFVTMAVLGLIALAAAVFVLPRAWWLQGCLPIWIVLVILPFALSRLGTYRQAQERWLEVQRGYPSIVAQLEFTGRL